jgi:GNAT superfamily N-acetyltransferase
MTADELFDEAMKSLEGHRGAEALRAELLALGLPSDRAWREPPGARLWLYDDAVGIVWAAAPQGVRGTLYVAQRARGQGRGTALLREMVLAYPGLHIFALPGDRQTKSLCEQVGLTAKLLLMSADPA